jgi:hypothetical protein
MRRGGSESKAKKQLKKIKQKNSINGDFLILFLNLKPLTITLSPQAGRGDSMD